MEIRFTRVWNGTQRSFERSSPTWNCFGLARQGEFMKQLVRLVSVFVAVLLFAAVCLAQQSGKKEYTFHGKVVSVDKSSKSLRVDGEKVEGWMSAMTMDYKIDNPSIIDKVKPGDRIMATVYDGDYVLHNVRVMGAGDSNPKK
jgi:Cu/Ag efflux protein CusF